jgi:hypothetical protein
MNIIDSFDYLYMGLFLNNTLTREFFIELAIDYNNLSIFNLNRVYLSRTKVNEVKHDNFNLFSYITGTDGNLYLIPRNQITEKMTTVYKLNLPILNYYPLSGNFPKIILLVKGSVPSLIGIDIINLPTFECYFRKAGNYSVSMTTFNKMNYYQEKETNYNLTITDVPYSDKIFYIIIILIIIIFCIIVIAREIAKARREPNIGWIQVANRSF